MKFLVVTLLAIAVVSGSPIGENKKICEPGALSKDACNDCICSPDGMSKACTMMLCPLPGLTEVRTRRDTILKVCQPGETKMQDCNSCVCVGDGTGWLCTEMGCRPHKTCTPGKRYQKYCNDCACGNDGRSEICTRKECPKNMYNEDGSLINDPTEVSHNSLLRQKRTVHVENTCEPGTTFKEYCNTCHCGNDGTTASCTMMFCSRDIYNKDGSMKVVGQSLGDAGIVERLG